MSQHGSSLSILCTDPGLPSIRRLHEAGLDLGWEVRSRAVPPWWQTDPEPPPRSPFLCRPGVFRWREALREHRRWRREGARALQTRRALAISSDQWATLRVARRAGLPIPRTERCERPRAPSWSGGCYVKGRRGSKGSHVLYAADRREAAEAVAFLWGQGDSPLVQEDLRPLGPVRRHWVLGDQVVASVESRPRDGEHRSNHHQGGELRACAALPRHAELAVAATRAVGLPFAGIDLIGDGEVRLLEVNAAPGLMGIEAATGLDLARRLLEFLLRRPT